jgi:hypothetical protein
MRRAHGKSSSRAPQEAEFNFGYFYRTLEEHVNAFAAQEGCPFTLTDIAVRVGGLLQDKALREQLRDSELVSQVRQDGEGTGLRRAAGAEAALHVRPHAGRTLSATARASIARAQRKRWRLQKKAAKAAQLAAAGKGKVGRPRTPGTSWRNFKTPEARSKEMMRRRALRAGAKPDPSKAKSASTYWARLSPSQRKGEMMRRAKVRKANAAKAAKVHAPAGANGAAVAA